MKATTTLGYFGKQILAKLTGNTDESQALKIEKKARKSIEAQIAALKYKKNDDEDLVETRKEALDNAIYTANEISDGKAYCDNILLHQDKLNQAEESLEITNNSITYFEAILAKF